MKLLCLKCVQLTWVMDYLNRKAKNKQTKAPKQTTPQTQQSSLTVVVFSTAGLQATTKHSGFPVRMDNAVPIVPQAPAAQPLQIQSGVLTQVKAVAAWILDVAEALLRIRYFVLEDGICFDCKIFLGHDSVDFR